MKHISRIIDEYRMLTDTFADAATSFELMQLSFYIGTEFKLTWLGKDNDTDGKILAVDQINDSELSKRRLFTDYGLLQSLIKLGEAFISETKHIIFPISKIKESEYHTDAIFHEKFPRIQELALKWCEEWGIPWADDELRRRFPYDIFNAYKVTEFYLSVCILYQRWLLWNCIEADDLINARVVVNNFKELCNDDNKLSKEKLKRILANDDAWQIQLSGFDIHANRNALSPLLSQSKSGYRVSFSGTDLVSLAYMQLYSFIAADRNSTKKCKLCSNLFFPKAGQEQYCPKCQKRRKALNKQNERARRKAQEQEALDNGEHNTP